MKQQKGIALVTVVIMTLFLVPFLSFLVITTQHHFLHSHKEKQLKMTGSFASNLLIDFMRQFSQEYYERRYDTEFLARGKTFYKAGFSEAITEGCSRDRRVYIHATGKYGKNPASPFANKDLHATIQFISDLTDYGTYLNTDMEISASNVTYYGKWWCKGNLLISGSNVRFVGGPLIVKGDLRVTGLNVRIESNVFYGGRLIGNPTITGTKFNFYPSDMVYPTIDESFYRANYNYKITTDSTIRFNAHPSSSTFSIVGTTITVPIIESGMTILGENCDLTVFGIVRGRITVVTTSTSPLKGRITIGLPNRVANLLYYNPLTGGTTTSAIFGNSFSAIAANGIIFQGKITWPTADLTVCGVFFDRSTTNMGAIGAWGRKFTLFGTRNKPIQLVLTDFGRFMQTGTEINYDIWLNKHPPPNLPERPVLVTWHLR